MDNQQGPTRIAQGTAQCEVAAWMGGEFRGEWIQLRVWPSPFPVHLKLSKHGWLPIPQGSILPILQNKKVFKKREQIWVRTKSRSWGRKVFFLCESCHLVLPRLPFLIENWMQPCPSLTVVERESLLNEPEDWGIKQSFGGKFKPWGPAVGNMPSSWLMLDTPALILEVM